MLKVVKGVRQLNEDHPTGKDPDYGERIAFICKDGVPFKTVYAKDYDYKGDTVFQGIGAAADGDDGAPEDSEDDLDEDFPGGASFRKRPRYNEEKPAARKKQLKNISQAEDVNLLEALELLKLVDPLEIGAYLKGEGVSAVGREVVLEMVRQESTKPMQLADKGERLFIYEKIMTAKEFFKDKIDPAFGAEDGGKEIILPEDGNLTFFPTYATKAFQMCVAGPTGVGKSVFCRQTAQLYRDEHALIQPKRQKGEKEDPTPLHRIIVWAYAPNDEAYSDISGLEYIPIDEELVKHPPNTDDYRDALHIFDDVEKIRDEVGYVVRHFRDEVLQNGRKKHMSCLSIIHELFNGLESRGTLNECGSLTVFVGGNREPIVKACKQKYCMSKEETAFVLSHPTRWVNIRRNQPRGCITPLHIRLW